MSWKRGKGYEKAYCASLEEKNRRKNSARVWGRSGRIPMARPSSILIRNAAKRCEGTACRAEGIDRNVLVI